MSISEIITGGLRGFAIFFSITLVIEFISYSIGITKSFKIDVMDFYTSLLGIALFIMVSIARHLMKEE